MDGLGTAAVYSGRKSDVDYKAGDPQDGVVIHTNHVRGSSQERSGVVRSAARQALKGVASSEGAESSEKTTTTRKREVTSTAAATQKAARQLEFATYNAAGGEVSVTEYFADLGPEVNGFCNRVFTKLLPQRVWLRQKTDAALAEHMKQEAGKAEWDPTPDEIKKYRASIWNKTFPEDFKKGTTFFELVTGRSWGAKESDPEACNLIYLLDKWVTEGLIPAEFFSDEDLEWFIELVKECGSQPIYPFLRGIRDNGDMENQGFYWMMKLGIECIQKKYDILPVFGHPSVPLMEGKGAQAHKQRLFEAIFLDPKIRGFILDPKNQTYVEANEAEGIKGVEGRFAPQTLLKALRNNVDTTLLKDRDGQPMTAERLARFSRPGLMALLFALYHSETFDIVLQEGVTTAAEANAINAKAKAVLGTAKEQAERFAKKMEARNITGIMLQECSKEYCDVLEEKYYLIESENTVTALRKTDWQNVTKLEHNHFNDKGKQDKLLCVKATLTATNQVFILSNIHGDAKKPEDGREKLEEAGRVAGVIENCVVAGDFNTKTEEHEKALRTLASKKGYGFTVLRGTTVKCRADTPQRNKDGNPIQAGGDVGLVNSAEYELVHAELDDPTCQTLPNKNNGSDHHIVYFRLQKIVKP